MVERFNFYDVYGHLLPGLCLMGLLWLPHGLVSNNLPYLEWSSALAAIVVGYVIGHVLHKLAEETFVLKVDGKLPSDILLNENDKTFPPAEKGLLVNAIKDQFGIDAKLPENQRSAFFLCRSWLANQGVVAYSQQFQGMYALTRGLTLVMVLGAFYHLGWVLHPCIFVNILECLPQWHWVPSIVLFVLLIVIDQSLRQKFKKSELNKIWLTRISLIVLFLFLGIFFASTSGDIPAVQARSPYLISIFFILLFAFRRFYFAYQDFAHRYAQSVYRDFLAHHSSQMHKDAQPRMRI